MLVPVKISGAADAQEGSLSKMEREYVVDEKRLGEYFESRMNRPITEGVVLWFEAAAVWMRLAYDKGAEGVPFEEAFPWLREEDGGKDLPDPTPRA